MTYTVQFLEIVNMLSLKFMLIFVLQEHTYGPEKASDLKTYQVMKTGLKNIDLSTGTSGPITSKKVQNRIVSAKATHRKFKNLIRGTPIINYVLYCRMITLQLQVLNILMTRSNDHLIQPFYTR
jgi:hypothetical protein